MKKDYPITIGDKVYKFRFNFDALTTMEDLTGKAFGALVNSSSQKDWKCVFFAGLKKNHPEVALENVGDLIDEADNLIKLKQQVSTALRESLGIEQIVAEAVAKKKNEIDSAKKTEESTGQESKLTVAKS